MDWHLGCPQALLNQAHTSSFTSVHSLHITLDGSPLRLKCNYIPPPPHHPLHTPIACHASAAVPRRYLVYSHPRAFAFADPSIWNPSSALLQAGLPSSSFQTGLV